MCAPLHRARRWSSRSDTTRGRPGAVSRSESRMHTIRSRLIIIGICVVVSIFYLVPRDQTQRVPDPTTGRMKDTTVRRVPIHLGLDLQGGVHLALEVDQTKGPVPDCAE